MAAHKMTPGQSQTLGCNFDNWSLKKKGKYQKKQDWGWSAPSAFFLGDGMDLSSSFFFRDGSHPLKKKGAKKGGSSFFYTDGPRSPFFFKAILQKIEGSPFFSFFFVDCVFRVSGWKKMGDSGRVEHCHLWALVVPLSGTWLAHRLGQERPWTESHPHKPIGGIMRRSLHKTSLDTWDLRKPGLASSWNPDQVEANQNKKIKNEGHFPLCMLAALKNSGKTPETLSELFLELIPLESTAGIPQAL